MRDRLRCTMEYQVDIGWAYDRRVPRNAVACREMLSHAIDGADVSPGGARRTPTFAACAAKRRCFEPADGTLATELLS